MGFNPLEIIKAGTRTMVITGLVAFLFGALARETGTFNPFTETAYVFGIACMCAGGLILIFDGCHYLYDRNQIDSFRKQSINELVDDVPKRRGKISIDEVLGYALSTFQKNKAHAMSMTKFKSLKAKAVRDFDRDWHSFKQFHRDTTDSFKP